MSSRKVQADLRQIRTGHEVRPVSYSIHDLASMVCMSVRTIRAHQTRGLLAPPRKDGKRAVYDDSHVKRLRTIVDLQQQGFNLAAIQAALSPANGVSRPDSQTLQGLHRAIASEPMTMASLMRHGVITRGPQGDLRVLEPDLLDSALKLRGSGMETAACAGLLALLLDELPEVIDDTLERVEGHTASIGDEPPPAQLAEVVVEACRVVAEQRLGPSERRMIG